MRHTTNRILLTTATLALLFLATITIGATTANAAACPNEAIREEQHAQYLPDCRAFELVTPVNKDEEEALIPADNDHYEDNYQASATAPGIVFSMTGGFPGSESAFQYIDGLALGGEIGQPWNATALDPQSTFEPTGEAAGDRNDGYVNVFSPELTCGFQTSKLPMSAHLGEETPLLPEGWVPGTVAANLYRYETATGARELVDTSAPRDPESSTENRWAIDGASQGCKRAAFNQSFGEPGFELPVRKGSSEYAPYDSIYEWTKATGGQLASWVPAESGTKEVPAQNVTVPNGGIHASNLNMMSESGENLFFSGKDEEMGVELKEGETTRFEKETVQIFDRYEGTHTYQVSQSDTTIPDDGALYEAASTDGTRVFFLSNYGIASNGTSAGSTAGCTRVKVNAGGVERPGEFPGCDLYEYHSSSGAPGGGELTDLTPDASESEGANVVGVAGLSKTGEYVYFSALGRLVPGEGFTNAENKVAKTANLYAYHDGHVSFITTITSEEAGERVSEQDEAPLDALEPTNTGHGLTFLAARVSADGSYIMFGSFRKQRVVGMPEPEYNNLDARLGQPDAELYEYRYTEGAPQVTCVSCNPSGARPVERLEEARTKLYEKFNGWPFVYNGVIPVQLLNDGRAFFDSYTPLVSGASEMVHTYEFEPDGYEGQGGTDCAQLKGCISLLEPGTNSDFPTFFVGASENGENAYITTVEPLAPQDDDGLRDVYDVREDGGQAATPAKEQCDLGEEKCQGSGTEPIGESKVGSGGKGEQTPGTLHEEPSPASLAPVKVMSRRVTSRGLTLTVRLPATAGFLRVSGKGLLTMAHDASGGTRTIKVSFSSSTASAVRHHRHPRITVTVLFRPFAATVGDTHASFTIKA